MEGSQAWAVTARRGRVERRIFEEYANLEDGDEVGERRKGGGGRVLFYENMTTDDGRDEAGDRLVVLEYRREDDLPREGRIDGSISSFCSFALDCFILGCFIISRPLALVEVSDDHSSYEKPVSGWLTIGRWHLKRGRRRGMGLNCRFEEVDGRDRRCISAVLGWTRANRGDERRNGIREGQGADSCCF